MTDISGDTLVQTAALEDLSEAVNYRRWLVDLALPHLRGPVLEIGSGTGEYAAEWAARGVDITASEADPGRLDLLHRRFGAGAGVDVRPIALPLHGVPEWGAVVALNVLEHIEDDVTALRSLRTVLLPGAHLVLMVPAFPFALGEFDRQIGHHRRYTVDSLRRVLTEAGYRPLELRYVNPVGLLAWFVLVRLLGGRPRAGAGLRAWDRFVVPALRRVDEAGPPPFGQSVFAVAGPADDHR